MKHRTASRLSLVMFWTTAGTAAVLTIGALMSGVEDAFDVIAAGVLLIAGMVAVSLLGTFIVRRTGNAIGWLFQVMAFSVGISFLSEGYIRSAYIPVERDLPLVPFVGWLNSMLSLLIVLPIPLLFLLFPTGKPLTPRWRWGTRLWTAGSVLVIFWAAFKSDAVYGTPPPDNIHIENPYGLRAPGLLFDTLINLGVFLLLLAGALGIFSLVVRFRRARGDERQQMKWLVFVGIVAAALIATGLLIDFVFGSMDEVFGETVGAVFFFSLVFVLLGGIPAAVAIAILKYRLYEIDVVINKTVVFGALAVFITAVYVGIVVGVGALVGRGGKPNVALSIAATAVVAILFQPVRERVQRFANRLVYGKRATPYEVMADFSQRMAGTLSVDEVLPNMAEAAATGVGAAAARVSVVFPGGGEKAANWPADSLVDSFDRTLDVSHGDAHVGEIAVTKPRGEPFTPAEEKLLEDLAAQAGLALHNVRLADDLQDRVEQISRQAGEIEISRRRIVRARDEALRQLERDIEGGARSQLLSISERLRLATDSVVEDPGESSSVLEQLGEEATDALETLRDLARGIFPPLLAEKGLVPSIEAHINKTKLPATLETDGTVGRFDPGVEAAIYFCCIEAMQNASKFAQGASITVKLRSAKDSVDFSIDDDGPGFDPEPERERPGIASMSDRVEAVGGTLAIRSSPGGGTTITGRIPAREREPAT